MENCKRSASLATALQDLVDLVDDGGPIVCPDTFAAIHRAKLILHPEQHADDYPCVTKDAAGAIADREACPRWRTITRDDVPPEAEGES